AGAHGSWGPGRCAGAAVDREDHACDVCGVWAGEEQCGAGDVLWIGDTVECYSVHQSSGELGVVETLLRELGNGEGRGDGVHAYPCGSKSRARLSTKASPAFVAL